MTASIAEPDDSTLTRVLADGMMPTIKERALKIVLAIGASPPAATASAIFIIGAFAFAISATFAS